KQNRRVAAAPNRNPAKRLRFGEEEQRRERALTYKISRSKRYKACSDVVPVTGLEPVRCRQRWILSPLRLPIPSHRQVRMVLYTIAGTLARGKSATFPFPAPFFKKRLTTAQNVIQ